MSSNLHPFLANHDSQISSFQCFYIIPSFAIPKFVKISTHFLFFVCFLYKKRKRRDLLWRVVVSTGLVVILVVPEGQYYSISRIVLLDDGKKYIVKYGDGHILSTVCPEQIFWLRRELIHLVSVFNISFFGSIFCIFYNYGFLFRAILVVLCMRLSYIKLNVPNW